MKKSLESKKTKMFGRIITITNGTFTVFIIYKLDEKSLENYDNANAIDALAVLEP